jgi:2-amino-4-hydroxy-6-hydroxymethyldihydropteridine diphosphokinase
MIEYESDREIVVALGGNLSSGCESSLDVLDRALDAFPKMGLVVKAKSSFWRSLAWPDPADPPYLNAVCLVQTALSAAVLLAALHELEDRFGRERGRINAPRVLDLDLIAYGRTIDPVGPPILPHPRAHLRRFVMGPLAQIAPDWRHPVTGGTAKRLAADATIGRDAQPLWPHSALHKIPRTPM